MELTSLEQSLEGENLGTVFKQCVSANQDSPALSWLTNVGKGKKPSLEEISYKELWNRVVVLAHALVSSTQQGDRVLLLGGNSPQWVIAELAVFMAGLALVPPFPIMTAEEIQHQVRHSKAVIAIVENQGQLDKLGALARTSLRQVITMLPTEPKNLVVGWDEFCEPFAGRVELPDRSRTLDLKTDSLHFYTESEFGFPVPVVHTHGSLLANIRYMQDTGICSAKDRVVEVLYFAHIYPLLIGLLALFSGATLVIPGAASNSARRDVRAMVQCLKYGRGDIAAIVPYFLHTSRLEIEKELFTPLPERVARLSPETPSHWLFWTGPWNLLVSYCKDMRSLMKEHGKFDGHLRFFRKFMLSEAVWSAKSFYRNDLALIGTKLPACFQGTSVPLALDRLEGWKLSYARAIFLLTKRVRSLALASVWGQSMRTIISGGSKLKHPNLEFFEALGLSILEGYGSSQSGIVSVQVRGSRLPAPEQIPETVGPPLGPEIEIRLATGTSEILIASPTLFNRYEGYPDLTARDLVFIGPKRFYRTADIGRLMPTADLRIIGHLDTRFRMYNSLGGEKVFPAIIESKIEECPIVQKAFVWGQDVPFNVAIVFVDQEKLAEQLRSEGRDILLRKLNGSNKTLDTGVKAYVSESLDQFIRKSVNPKLSGPAKVRSAIVADRSLFDYPDLLTIKAPDEVDQNPLVPGDESNPPIELSWSINHELVVQAFYAELKECYGDLLI